MQCRRPKGAGSGHGLLQALSDLSAPASALPRFERRSSGRGRGRCAPTRPARRRAGGAPRPDALGRQYSRSAEALVRGGSAAGGGRDPDTGAAGTEVARRGTSNMSSKCDVVVVGGGISGQWRLRALLPLPGLRQVAAQGGTQGGSGAGCRQEPLDPSCAPRGKDLVRPWTEAKGWKCVEGLGLDFELFPGQLPSLS